MCLLSCLTKWQSAFKVDGMEKTKSPYTCNYTVLFEPAEEGGYTVTVPALPSVVTEGDTLEEARAMAKDAIRLYLKSLEEEGRPFPPTWS